MNRQLDRIRKAYDLTVEQKNNGINPIDNLPGEIRDLPGYRYLMASDNVNSSGNPDIRQYLAPEKGMCFLDAGCCANLINYRPDQWLSTYYGIDISPRLIGAMTDLAGREKMTIGGLYVAELAKIPFNDNFFDIAAVIGLLEYATLNYVKKALIELNRVLKPGTRVVLDIPNEHHIYVGDMVKLEQYLGRPDYIHSRLAFESLLKPLFSVDHIDDSEVMLKYFLRTIK